MRNRLPLLRAERGWTQEDLAQRLGVTRQTVISIERERYDPSLPLAFRIAAAFETSIEAIFVPADAATEPAIELTAEVR